MNNDIKKKLIKSYKKELENIKESLIYFYEVKDLKMQNHFIDRQAETEKILNNLINNKNKNDIYSTI